MGVPRHRPIERPIPELIEEQRRRLRSGNRAERLAAAIVGRTYAVADLRFSRFAGFAGWSLWAGVHIYFLIGFANRLFVLLQWGLDFLTKRRRVRVLSAEPPSAENLIDPVA